MRYPGRDKEGVETSEQGGWVVGVTCLIFGLFVRCLGTH